MQKMQEHFSVLHCPTTRHPWRNAKSAFTPSLALSCRQAPMDGFTAFLDRHTPHPKIGETAQTGNCWKNAPPILNLSHNKPASKTLQAKATIGAAKNLVF